ncbi:hypothetical protein BJV38_000261 [Clostridium beijerinckii]|nr:hypothetical protein [Clostridium beijerinckii]NRT43418.1 hypothetical protein [Clostridium beijerinckii]NRZ22591.1 hypothetical protein [Clostridium beijerinckii]
MKKFIKRIIRDKLYIGSLIFILILYITRTNYIEEILFSTTNLSKFSEYSLLVLYILGATIFMGTILFISLSVFIFMFKRFTLPTWKKLIKLFRN